VLERAGVPIVKEGAHYKVVEGWTPALQFGVDAQELTALFIARELGAGLRGTRCGAALDSLWTKLTTGRGMSGALFPPSGVGLSVRGPSAFDYGALRTTLSALYEAVDGRRAIRCRYAARSTGELTERTIEPGQLHWDPALETTYLIGYCRLRGDLRVFAAHRFVSVDLLDETCRPRSGLTSREALTNAFRIWRGSNVREVRIRFSARVAGEIRERRWHASERKDELPDGGLRLTLELSALEEVERWLLGFGGDALAEAPAELVDRLRDAHRAALDAYSRSPRRASAKITAPARRSS
jgi:predicted DNA-binding transcriptional regulator YafY